MWYVMYDRKELVAEKNEMSKSRKDQVKMRLQ